LNCFCKFYFTSKICRLIIFSDKESFNNTCKFVSNLDSENISRLERKDLLALNRFFLVNIRLFSNNFIINIICKFINRIYYYNNTVVIGNNLSIFKMFFIFAWVLVKRISLLSSILFTMLLIVGNLHLIFGFILILGALIFSFSIHEVGHVYKHSKNNQNRPFIIVNSMLSIGVIRNKEIQDSYLQIVLGPIICTIIGVLIFLINKTNNRYGIFTIEINIIAFIFTQHIFSLFPFASDGKNLIKEFRRDFK